jgi:hypothetical protein
MATTIRRAYWSRDDLIRKCAEALIVAEGAAGNLYRIDCFGTCAQLVMTNVAAPEGMRPDAEAAIYCSGVPYATIGYSELVLAKPWRVLALIEGLTGILRCGLSTGVCWFAVVNRIDQAVRAATS